MDGHDNLGCSADFGIGEQCPQIYRNKTCLPVVAVDDIRDEANNGKGSQNRLVKVDELLEVIRHFAVRIAPAEEFLIVDEIADHTVKIILLDADIPFPAVVADLHIEVGDVLHLFFVLILDAAVKRHDDTGIAAFLVQRTRKCIHDIAETAGLGKRVGF